MMLFDKRKLGDSNPRYGCPYVSLANWWFQPLTQTSFLWGSWRIRTAVHGFADRWLSHSSKEPERFAIVVSRLRMQRYNYFLDYQILDRFFVQFSCFFWYKSHPQHPSHGLIWWLIRLKYWIIRLITKSMHPNTIIPTKIFCMMNLTKQYSYLVHKKCYNPCQCCCVKCSEQCPFPTSRFLLDSC